MQGINFIAIDFETATGKRASICEAGICVVRDGEIVRPQDTINSPEFPEVWAEISKYLEGIPVLVAHNAAFDIGCIRHSLELYGIEKPNISYYCSLRAARRLYSFGCNSLDYLCDQFKIPYGQHHRAGDDAEMCARLFLREIQDSRLCGLEVIKYYGEKL